MQTLNVTKEPSIQMRGSNSILLNVFIIINTSTVIFIVKNLYMQNVFKRAWVDVSGD